jgi:hypothetical protein
MAGLTRTKFDEPRGLARLFTAYLACLLAAMGALLIAVIASAIIDSTDLCAVDDPLGLCQPVFVGASGAVAFWVLLAVMAKLLALGVATALWITLLDVVLVQMVIQTGQFTWFAFGVIIPGLVVVMLWSPSGRSSTCIRAVRGLVGTLIFAQLVVWIIQFWRG